MWVPRLLWRTPSRLIPLSSIQKKVPSKKRHPFVLLIASLFPFDRGAYGLCEPNFAQSSRCWHLFQQSWHSSSPQQAVASASRHTLWQTRHWYLPESSGCFHRSSCPPSCPSFSCWTWKGGPPMCRSSPLQILPPMSIPQTATANSKRTARDLSSCPAAKAKMLCSSRAFFGNVSSSHGSPQHVQ